MFKDLKKKYKKNKGGKHDDEFGDIKGFHDSELKILKANKAAVDNFCKVYGSLSQKFVSTIMGLFVKFPNDPMKEFLKGVLDIIRDSPHNSAEYVREVREETKKMFGKMENKLKNVMMYIKAKDKSSDPYYSALAKSQKVSSKLNKVKANVVNRDQRVEMEMLEKRLKEAEATLEKTKKEYNFAKNQLRTEVNFYLETKRIMLNVMTQLMFGQMGEMFNTLQSDFDQALPILERAKQFDYTASREVRQVLPIYDEHSDSMEISSVIPGKLFLGNREGAMSSKLLKTHGIKAVVNCSTEIENYHPDFFAYFNIPVVDLETQNVLEHFENFFNIIQSSGKGPFFVHCVGGISRSTTLVISYLMKARKMRFYDAYLHVRQRRRVIYPNEGFVKQLLHFEKILFGCVKDMKPKLILPRGVTVVQITDASEGQTVRYENPDDKKLDENTGMLEAKEMKEVRENPRFYQYSPEEKMDSFNKKAERQPKLNLRQLRTLEQLKEEEDLSVLDVGFIKGGAKELEKAIALKKKAEKKQPEIKHHMPEDVRRIAPAMEDDMDEDLPEPEPETELDSSAGDVDGDSERTVRDRRLMRRRERMAKKRKEKQSGGGDGTPGTSAFAPNSFFGAEDDGDETTEIPAKSGIGGLLKLTQKLRANLEEERVEENTVEEEPLEEEPLEEEKPSFIENADNVEPKAQPRMQPVKKDTVKDSKSPIKGRSNPSNNEKDSGGNSLEKMLEKRAQQRRERLAKMGTGQNENGDDVMTEMIKKKRGQDKPNRIKMTSNTFMMDRKKAFEKINPQKSNNPMSNSLPMRVRKGGVVRGRGTRRARGRNPRGRRGRGKKGGRGVSRGRNRGSGRRGGSRKGVSQISAAFEKKETPPKTDPIAKPKNTRQKLIPKEDTPKTNPISKENKSKGNSLQDILARKAQDRQKRANSGRKNTAPQPKKISMDDSSSSVGAPKIKENVVRGRGRGRDGQKRGRIPPKVSSRGARPPPPVIKKNRVAPPMNKGNRGGGRKVPPPLGGNIRRVKQGQQSNPRPVQKKVEVKKEEKEEDLDQFDLDLQESERKIREYEEKIREYEERMKKKKLAQQGK